MTIRVLLSGLALWLAAICAQPAGGADKEVVPFGYLGREGDSAYQESRAYTGLVLRDRKPPIDGAKTALRESRVLGRSIGKKFELRETLLPESEDAVAAVRAAMAEGTRVFLLDLPLDDVKAVARTFAGEEVLLFNIRHGDDSLRGEDCAPALFHTLPSDSMIMDGLAQYLAKKGWRDTLILQGDSARDETVSAAFQASAEKFGLDVVDVKPYVLSNDPRVRADSNVAILTGEDDHDVVFLADSLGDFGRYVPYQTYNPRPVVGSEGLTPSAWHWTWERHGAPQLNQRFDRIAERRMQDPDYAAWAAIKAVVEAIVRTESSEVPVLREFLTGDDLTLDTYKGAPGSFRPWDLQLRQPILLHTHNAVIARAPFDAFLHEKNILDTLGKDERESACRLD